MGIYREFISSYLDFGLIVISDILINLVEKIPPCEMGKFTSNTYDVS